jgi:predicted PurR-regulated permease PerM
MKTSERERPASGVLAASAGIALLLLSCVLLYYGRLFFITTIVAVLLAFLLEPVVTFLMRFRLPRGVASFISCSMMITVLYLAGLGLWVQVVDFWDELPGYTRKITDLVDSATSQVETFERSFQDLLVPKRIREARQSVAPPPKADRASRRKKAAEPVPPVTDPLAPPPVQEVRIRDDSTVVNQIYEWFIGFSDALLMASFVPFLVYFFLSWRDHLRRGLMSVLTADKREMAERAMDGIVRVARAYLVGNFILGLIISVLSSLFFWYIKLPYWQVAGPMSGFLSLVPYLGLPLALVPPFAAALPVYTGLAVYLMIAAVVGTLHLVALNLLYPKIVGARVHLNPVVVTVALMSWYLLWGGAGLVLAMPIAAGVKAALDSVPGLRVYGRLLGD